MQGRDCKTILFQQPSAREREDASRFVSFEEFVRIGSPFDSPLLLEIAARGSRIHLSRDF